MFSYILSATIMDFRTGESITAAQAQSGIYFWELRNPIYTTITEHIDRPFNTNHDILNIQIRFNHNLRKALGIHKCYLNFKVWTRLRSSTSRFLRVFNYSFMKRLNSLGVISINTCINSVDYVLYNVLDGTINVEENHIIKFNIY
ncbi:replication enhancer [Asystasia mosaic Madagascar virus]|uniref:Replication enhancer n=2 Tax=Begomovirus TaxID=10814 RepID=A0A0C5B4W8_9GEMI|nr:replication enhancer [Asystasia mosaic Madagascar virus]AJM13614.1 replication enhancer [Asystasia mosaic Madagascar virus]